MSYTYKIFPAIGIARVGTSNQYYIGPESEGALPINPDGSDFSSQDFRDGDGKLKRQAARFQVFRVDQDGNAEALAPADVESIQWTVHLANKKAIWYEFQTYQGEEGYAPNHPLRNAGITDAADRQKLIIDPGPRSVTWSPTTLDALASAEFDRASTTPDADDRFPPTPLYPLGNNIDTLGGLRLDSEGCLLVLGGHGHAGTPGDNLNLPEYANNDNWFDDTADGPVQATLTLKGETVPVSVEPAWVLAGPPSYAPQIPNVVTLYDTIFDAAVRKMAYRTDIFENGLWKDDFQPYFDTDIRPVLERTQHYPWVVAIPPKPHRFDMEKLGDPDPGYNGLRQRILGYLRAPGDENVLIDSSSGGTQMPYLAGDGVVGPETKKTEKFLRITDTQYFLFQQWASGNFHGTGEKPDQDSAEALTEGVLHNCVGGAFSPGIEMTWVSRLPQVYSTPFRIRVSADTAYPLDLGWNPETGCQPGDITKFMAIPWQADFNECSAQPADDRTLWWWPPQRPAHVYTKLIDHPTPRDTIIESVILGEIKQKAWVGTTYDMNAADFIAFSSNLDMVKNWDRLGFIYNESDDPEKPLFVEVESQSDQVIKGKKD